jgi:uncharacterized protein (DUF2336 family)
MWRRQNGVVLFGFLGPLPTGHEGHGSMIPKSYEQAGSVQPTTSTKDTVSLSADELFALARNKSAEGRRNLFSTVCDLFLGESVTLSDRERSLMGEILRQLVRDVEVTVRKAVADRLAKRSDAPYALVVELANDQIEVAHGILKDCDLLRDADLIEVIRHRTMEHQVAVATRKSLSATVSSALVETGNQDVIATLLNNHGATISREVMDYLVNESKRIDAYQNPLVRRPDLPQDLAQRMYWWVSAALRKHIAQTFSVDMDAVDDAIEQSAMSAIREDAEARAKPGKTESLIERVTELGELKSDFLIKALKQGELSLFEAGLARMSGLKLTLLRRILYEPGGEGLAMLCRAINVERQAFATIYELTRKASDRGAQATSGTLVDPVQLYDKTKTRDAERVLKRWRRSSDYLDAMKDVGAEA